MCVSEGKNDSKFGLKRSTESYRQGKYSPPGAG